MNFVKINVDFTAFSADNLQGLGAITRDANGGFIAARSQRGDGMLDPYIGELLAAKVGLFLA